MEVWAGYFKAIVREGKIKNGRRLQMDIMIFFLCILLCWYCLLL